VPGGSGSPAPKIQMSADSWQPEGASLENCFSASYAHGTARTEAQRLGLLACVFSLKTSNVAEGSVPSASGSRAVKCKRLQIAGSQKGLAWKAVAQPHLPVALLAQRHRGCLLVLPPQTSIVAWE